MENNNQKQQPDDSNSNNKESTKSGGNDDTPSTPSAQSKEIIHEDVCSICFDDVSLLDATFTICSACGKTMHKDCFKRMAGTKSVSDETRYSCPICRAPNVATCTTIQCSAKLSTPAAILLEPHNSTDLISQLQWMKQCRGAARSLWNSLVDVCLQEGNQGQLHHQDRQCGLNFLQTFVTTEAIETRGKPWELQLDSVTRERIALDFFRSYEMTLKAKKAGEVADILSLRRRKKRDDRYTSDINSGYGEAVIRIEVQFGIKNKGEGKWQIKVKTGSSYKGNTVKNWPGYMFHHLVFDGRGPIPLSFKNRCESMTDNKYKSYEGADPNNGRKYLDKEKYCYLCWDINGRVHLDFQVLLPLPPMGANSILAPQTQVPNEIVFGATPVMK